MTRFISLFFTFIFSLSLGACLLTFAPDVAQASRADSFLGSGFSTDSRHGITGLSGAVDSNFVDERGGGFAESGTREINALLYNAVDFLKYAAAAFAALWVVISAIQLVTSGDDETVKSAKNGIKWSMIGLVVIFTTNIVVIAFFEGGSVGDTGVAPGASIVDAAGNSFVLQQGLAQNIASFFLQDVRALFSFFKVWGWAFAVFFLFVAGLWMVNAAGDEDTIEKSKSYMVHLLTAFTALILLETFIFDFIFPLDAMRGDHPACLSYVAQMGAQNGLTTPFSLLVAGQEVACAAPQDLARTGINSILGVVRFFETIVGTISVFFLVYAGIRIVASFGEEEVISAHKKQLLYSLAGLAIVLFSEQVIMRFFFVTDMNTGQSNVNITQGILDLAGIANFLITLVAVFSMVSFFIAGVLWVANFGNTELADKAKKAIIAALAGIVLSIAAYALTSTLIAGRADYIDGDSLSVDTPIGTVQIGD